MANELFRKTALDRLSSPEQLNQLVAITSPRAWITLGAISLLLLAAILWSFFGSIPSTVSGQGIITYPRGIDQVVSYGTGVISFSGPLHMGDKVEPGQVLATIALPELKSQLQAARQNFERLESGFNGVADSVAREKKRQEAAYKAEIELKQEAIKVKREEIEWLQHVLDGQQEMLKEGYVSKQDHENTLQQILITKNDILGLREDVVNAMAELEQELQSEDSRLVDLQIQLNQARYQVIQLESQLDVQSRVITQTAGRIIEIMANSGEAVEAGKPVFAIAPEGGDLIAVLYLPPAGLAKRVVSGVRAEISPAAYEKERYGYLIGSVSYVSPYPVGASGMMPILGNQSLVDTLTAKGALVEVRVELIPDKSTLSGYQWSSKHSQDIRLSAGSWCSGSFVVQKNRPISLVLPILKTAAEL
jgi:HlyD family secretion protein